MRSNEDTFGRRIFIGGLARDEDSGALEQILREHYEPFGTIVDVHVALDWNTNCARGFAFLTFEDPQSAVLAISSTHGTEIDGHRVDVNMARPKNYKAARRE